MGESEIGVIESWVSTYFVIGAREILFCNEVPPQKTSASPPCSIVAQCPDRGRRAVNARLFTGLAEGAEVAEMAANER